MEGVDCVCMGSGRMKWRCVHGERKWWRCVHGEMENVCIQKGVECMQGTGRMCYMEEGVCAREMV